MKLEPLDISDAHTSLATLTRNSPLDCDDGAATPEAAPSFNPVPIKMEPGVFAKRLKSSHSWDVIDLSSPVSVEKQQHAMSNSAECDSHEASHFSSQDVGDIDIEGDIVADLDNSDVDPMANVEEGKID